MTWPAPGLEPVSRLRVRAKAVILLVDAVTQKPPPAPPRMRLQRLLSDGPVDVEGRTLATVGGAAVLDGFDEHVPDLPFPEHYRLTVTGDAVLLPERPGGYAFTVPAAADRWPARVAVRLLPGPAYPYLPRTPVVHGCVLTTARAPVPDAVVRVGEQAPAGTTTVTCRCDHLGRFSLGIPRYRPSRAMTISARAPGGQSSAERPLTPRFFDRSVHLMVRA